MSKKIKRVGVEWEHDDDGVNLLGKNISTIYKITEALVRKLVETII
jgi:hypothetical protein